MNTLIIRKKRRNSFHLFFNMKTTFMKERKLIVMFLTISVFGFGLFQNGFACSMFKVTMFGKTMVGNNEDYWNPNTRIWFEQGKNGEYGAAYVGFDNFFPQGGMNQAGLVFDGFSEDYKAISDTIGKTSLGMDFLKDILKKCATVDDVKKYLSQHNLSGLETSMFLFIDKTGKYLVAEGDSLIIGNKPSYVLSHDYTHVVEYSLNHQLKKGDFSLVIPELFPENKKGHEFVNNYNEISIEIDLFKDNDLLNDSIRYRYVTNTIFRKDVKLIRTFTDKINEIGEMWLDKQNYTAAILVFKFNVKVSPKSWNAIDLLADAYMR